MLLNYIWAGFILAAFVVAFVRPVCFGDPQVFVEVVASTFSSARTGFEVPIGLTGVLSLWMGLMRVGERGGMRKRVNVYDAFV